MTIHDLTKLIGTRFVQCHLQICGFAVIALMLCLMGQGVYVLTSWAASFVSDPWFGYAAHAFRIILFTAAFAEILVGIAISESRFLRGACHDTRQYLSSRRSASAKSP